MKPNTAAPACPDHRPRLAELALGTLAAPESRELRAHLDRCPGCQRYWEEMNGLCLELREAGDALPDTQAGERFHRELRNRLHHEPARPGLSGWPRLARLTLPPALVAAACVTLALLCLRPSPHPASPLAQQPAPPAPPAPPVPARAPIAPTWNAYQRIANLSLETLDDVISNQAIHTASASPAPAIYALSRREVEE